MNKREKLIVYVAGGVIGLLLLDRVVVTPLWDAYTLSQDRIRNAERALADADQLGRNSLNARRNWQRIAGSTVHNNASEAESQLLNGVRVWAQQAGVNLTSLKPERTDSEEGFERLVVRAVATGRMENLGRFLYAAETSSIPVRVADAVLASRRDGEDDLSLQVGFATIFDPPVSRTQETTR